MFPRAAGLTFTGSATANYFFTTYGTYAGSDLDALNDMDRDRGSPTARCISVFGCNTFFPLQNAGMRTWVNAGFSRTCTAASWLCAGRSAMVGDSTSTTRSRTAIDLESAAESAAGGGTWRSDSKLIQSRSASRASSDFDIRHNLSGNTVLELPFGEGKPI